MKVARLVILDNWGKPLALSIKNSPAPIALQNTLMCHFWTVHSLYFLRFSSVVITRQLITVILGCTTWCHRMCSLAA